MLQAAIFASPDSEARKLAFPHSPGYCFESNFYTKVTHGEFARNTFVFVGIILNEDETESDELIVGSIDLTTGEGEATTGHRVNEREGLEKLTGFSLPH
jgi:hypothetical protein